jgi:glycosyltransferase involved in cell wall biosynthesis
LEDIEAHYIKIPLVSKGTQRPLWSVVIPTYNCAHYLKETLQSVLMQDPGADQMEIIVVDDHSTQDNPERVVNEIGKGRVRFIQQNQNVGKVKNYETGLQASSGYFIHQLHGDDMVLPGFYKMMTELLQDHPEAGAAFCRTIYIDSQGRWTGMTGMVQTKEGIVSDMAEKLYTEQYIQTPSMVVKREVYETLGTFDRRLNCMEDWEMWIRIANTFPIAASNRVLALYRTHSENSTNLTLKDGSALKTHQLICKLVDDYIQPEIKRKYQKKKDQKQAEFWFLSYMNARPTLVFKQKWKYFIQILGKDFNLKYFYRLFKNS